MRFVFLSFVVDNEKNYYGSLLARQRLRFFLACKIRLLNFHPFHT